MYNINQLEKVHRQLLEDSELLFLFTIKKELLNKNTSYLWKADEKLLEYIYSDEIKNRIAEVDLKIETRRNEILGYYKQYFVYEYDTQRRPY